MAGARPLRSPVIKIKGMGKRPAWDSRLAAIKPKVVVGSSVMASGKPTRGNMLATDISAMNKKNKPDMAKG
ncbi:MAG: hypothetical protein Fur007_21840 [Rhodoferax sp.]